MSAEKIKAAGCAKIIFNAMNARKFDELEERLADNVIFDFPGAEPVKGRRRALLFLKVLLRKYPRLTFKIEDLIAEGDKVCVRWSNAGENSRGEPYNNRGVTLVELSGAKINYISDYFKDTSFVGSRQR